ncbi:hypothetical protein [Psychrobacillus sp. NPDC096389]|uniref:hypothetical protein n=1 Tax=Psychrobacillus sp. NPDC096389 TaxID=3364490 RepID=UPI0037F249E5
MVQYNNENPSPTLAEIFASERKEGILEGEKKGIEQGKLEEGKSIARTLLSKKCQLLRLHYKRH